MSGPELASFLHSYPCAPHPHTCFHTPGSKQALSGPVLPCIHTLIDVYTHTYRSMYTHTQRSMHTHTNTEECALTYRPYRSVHTHTFTKAHIHKHSCKPAINTSTCRDTFYSHWLPPTLSSKHTLSSVPQRHTVGSLLSHGDSSIGLSFTGLPVSIIGTWNGSRDVRRRDSGARPLCFGDPCVTRFHCVPEPCLIPSGITLCCRAQLATQTWGCYSANLKLSRSKVELLVSPKPASPAIFPTSGLGKSFLPLLRMKHSDSDASCNV